LSDRPAGIPASCYGNRGAPERTEAINPASRRVLIADDEPRVLALLRDFLAGQGYEVSTVETGAAALQAVPIFQPNVIIVDMQMPGFSGRDVLDSLRRTGVSSQ
jgi:CheY-like chemotaxis protein